MESIDALVCLPGGRRVAAAKPQSVLDTIHGLHHDEVRALEYCLSLSG
jgi:hypothetical protein